MTNSDRKGRGFGTTCGHVSKYYNSTRDSFRFRENSIVKLSFYHNEFVVLRIV